MNTIHPLFSSLICLCFLFTFPTYASKIDSTSIHLDEVSVTARSQYAKRLHLPNQFQRITSTDIKKSQALNTADLIESSGVVSLQKSQQGGGSPVIRGFEASRILLVMDGVRMNNLIYRSGHLQNIITTDHASISELDILYGPSSVEFGSDALGGTIHLQTKSPQVTVDDEVQYHGAFSSGYYSANHGLNAHVESSVSTKKMGALISLSTQILGDLRSGKNKNPFLEGDEYITCTEYVRNLGPNDEVLINNDPAKQRRSGYNQYDGLVKLLYVPNRSQQHKFNLQFSTSSEINRYDRLTDRVDGELKFAEWYYGPQQRFFASYELDLVDTGTFDRVSLLGAYQHIQESRHNRKLHAEYLNNRVENVDVFSISLDAEKQMRSHHIRTGIDVNLNFLNSEAYASSRISSAQKKLDTRYPDDGNQMHSVEAYALHQYRITPRLILNDGIRIGGSFLHSNLTDNQFYPFPFREIKQNNFTYSASAGLVYNPSQRSKLSFLLSSGFRVPNVDDVGKIFDTQPGRVIIPNANLKPEKTLSTEFNFSQYIGANSRVEFSVYYTNLWDAITVAPSSINGQDSILYEDVKSEVLSNKNAKQGFVTGAHFSFFSQWNRFSTEGYLTYTYGRVKEQNTYKPMDHIAPLFGRLALKYQYLGTSPFNQIELFTLFNGKKRKQDYDLEGEDNIRYATVKGILGEGLPAWFTLNFRAAYSIKNNWLIQVSLLNLLDTQYRTFASGINAAGRSYNVSFSYQF